MPFDRENALFVEFGRTGDPALPPVVRESNSENKFVQQGLDVSSKGKKHEHVILDCFVLESGVFGQLGVHVHRDEIVLSIIKNFFCRHLSLYNLQKLYNR